VLAQELSGKCQSNNNNNNNNKSINYGALLNKANKQIIGKH